MPRHAVLPAALRPVTCDGLVRLGGPHDGGYLVDARDVAAAGRLVSFGIDSDWSFERDFLARNPVPLIAYDGSIDRRAFVKRALKSAHAPGRALHFLRAAVDYGRFFRGRRRHVRRFVGFDAPPSWMSFADALAAGGDGPDFLKIDIEGGEYRLLDALVARAPTTCGLAIEFHDVDIHLPRILEFVARYPLALVHLHANNHAPVTERGVPLVLEMTFAAAARADAPPADLPHPLDRPNSPDRPEIAIRFADADGAAVA